MKPIFLAAGAALFASVAAAHPHSYVEQQAALVLDHSELRTVVTIVPSNVEGAEIFDFIDTDGNGVLSHVEAEAFAHAVLAQTVLVVDGHQKDWTLSQVNRPSRDEVAAGHSAIRIEARTEAPLSQSSTVVFEMGYEQIAHDWQIQPYLTQALSDDGLGAAITRSGLGVDLRLTGPE